MGEKEKGEPKELPRKKVRRRGGGLKGQGRKRVLGGKEKVAYEHSAVGDVDGKGG